MKEPSFDKLRNKICSLGHHFIKSSDCPVCPICERQKKLKETFLSFMAAPARRALENKGITSLEEISKYSKAEILELHGFGPASIPKLEKALKEKGLSFQLKKKDENGK